MKRVTVYKKYYGGGSTSPFAITDKVMFPAGDVGQHTYGISDGTPRRRRNGFDPNQDFSLAPTRTKVTAADMQGGVPKILGKEASNFGLDSTFQADQPTNIFDKIGDVVPYVSNIANSFRKMPLPVRGRNINPVAGQRVSYANQLNEVDRQIRGANKAAENSLDENSAAAVRSANLATGIRGKNSVFEAESNANAGMAMQTSQLNANIDAQNVAYDNMYSNQLTEGQIARQREQSQNLANAADKYIAQGDQKAAAKLDLDKLSVYKTMFTNSGVYERELERLRKENPNIDGITTNTKKKYGGRIKVKF